MSQDRPAAKRSPREAAPKAASSKATTSVASKLASKKPAAPKNVVFSIPKGGGIWYKIKQDDVVIYDAENGYNREIRYCPAEKSIYLDEQSPAARREQIVFREGTLQVSHTRPNLIEYLRNHPDNKANGGSRFIEVKNEVNAEAELEKEFLLHDAVSWIKENDLDTILPLALSYGISADLSSLEIKRALLQQAKGNPASFMEQVSSPLVALKAVVITALDFQILKSKADGMYWFDSNSLICPTPAGADTKATFVRFLMSERGYDVREEIERQLNSL